MDIYSLFFMNPPNTIEASPPGKISAIPESIIVFLGTKREEVSDILSLQDTLSEKIITQKDIDNPRIWNYLILEGSKEQWEGVATMECEKEGDAGVLLDALKLFFLGKGDMLDILTEDNVALRDILRPIFVFVTSRIH